MLADESCVDVICLRRVSLNFLHHGIVRFAELSQIELIIQSFVQNLTSLLIFLFIRIQIRVEGLNELGFKKPGSANIFDFIVDSDCNLFKIVRSVNE